ncbi:hypothetical protein [Porphyromonas gulae]|uniref:hypothetical protein n=1 Tax=Porphyromonas gulae TaxID=111105 RepID=UPI00051D41D8|nr:hypothetical protein [Porphyromonas gulae]KGL48865.1 hypothetical protein HQ49_03420 [Porphyromonas gulae]
MASQEIKRLKLKDLVLWTENPRDPIDINAKDQDIVDRAIEDEKSKWLLHKLAKEMGEFYDFSELPTVVYQQGKPVVYDGNRRVILGKIKHKLVTVKADCKMDIPAVIPEEIPCNVCDKEVALKNIYRKHSDSGSWGPLERDIFLHKYMGYEKSDFLIIEDTTKMISAYPHLNKRFVKEEILKKDILEKLGFRIKDGKFESVYDENDALSVLENLSRKILEKEITTRRNRGKIVEVLDDPIQSMIKGMPKTNDYKDVDLDFSKGVINGEEGKKKRQTRRTQKKEFELFGEKLSLKHGEVNNLYRDICFLHQVYEKHQNELSDSFIVLIRMSLRLLCESAAKEDRRTINEYLQEYYDNAVKSLGQNDKTTLSADNVTKTSITQLLHLGAHNYKASSNKSQTYSISLVLGKMLTLTHGKK